MVKNNLHFYILKNVKNKFLLFFLLLVASISEFIGLSLLYPIINLLFEIESSIEAPLIKYVYNFFDFLNITKDKFKLISFFCFIIFIKAILLILYKYFCTFSTLEFMNNFRKKIFKKFFKSKYLLLVDKKSEISNAISIQSDLAQSAMQIQFNLFENIFIIFTLIILLTLLSLKVLIVSLIISLIFIFFFLFTFKISRKLAKNLADKNRNLFNLIDKTTLNIKYLKISMIYKSFYDQMINVFENIKTTTLKFILMNRGTKLLIEPLLVLNLSIIFFISTMILNVSFEIIIIIYIILARLIQKSLGLISLLQEYFKDLVSVKYCMNLINQLDENRDYEGHLKVDKFNSISLENITFGYNNEDIILNSVSLNINKNSLTTIFGPSGSGKTTISNILLGLIQPTIGKVLINGNELKNYDLNTFWQSVGYISQDSTIYNLTLRENLKLRNNKISDDTLYKYLNEYGLNKIGASDKINLDMKIDESSSNLSNGEKQRICLIREVLAKPELLILDEFTSSLDNKNIQNIIKIIKKLKFHTTIFIITHQEEYKKISDKIYYLNNSKISFD